MQTKLKEPKLCEDRGRFFVWLDGKRHYFTAKNKAEAEVKRKQFLANLWLGNPVTPSRVDGSSPPVPEGEPSPPQGAETGDMLVAELSNEFLKYHALRLSKSEIQNFKYAIAYLVELFGSLPVNEITPKKIRAVRDRMVRSRRLCRKTINSFVARLVRIFAWGCEEEWVVANVAGALKMVKHLPLGELGTFDHEEREPVPDDVIRRTLPFMPPTLRAMVQLQRILGMRPNEIFKMRVGDIDTTQCFTVVCVMAIPTSTGTPVTRKIGTRPAGTSISVTSMALPGASLTMTCFRPVLNLGVNFSMAGLI